MNYSEGSHNPRQGSEFLGKIVAELQATLDQLQTEQVDTPEDLQEVITEAEYELEEVIKRVSKRLASFGVGDGDIAHAIEELEKTGESTLLAQIARGDDATVVKKIISYYTKIQTSAYRWETVNIVGWAAAIAWLRFYFTIFPLKLELEKENNTKT